MWTRGSVPNLWSYPSRKHHVHIVECWMESQHRYSCPSLSCRFTDCTSNTAYDRQTWSSNGSLLHHLKNNRSQEDTWHNNCVWWRGGGMLKAGPAWESSQRRLPFQSQRSRWLVVVTEAIWESRPPNSSPTPLITSHWACFQVLNPLDLVPWPRL